MGIPFKRSASINHSLEVLPEDKQGGEDGSNQSGDASDSGGSSQNSEKDAGDNS